MFNNKWVVLGGCLIALTFSFAPVYLFTLGVFSKTMIAEFGWSRTEASAGFSVAQLSVAVFSLFSGMAVDRLGNRRVIIFAAFALPLCLAAFSLISSFAMYVILASVLGAVATASNPPAVLSVLPRWFDRNLGLSLAIASVGIGVGGMIMPLAAGIANEHFGWRGGFVVIAAVVVVVGVANAIFLLRDRPASPVTQARATSVEEPGQSFADTVKSLDYWVLVIAFAIIGALYWGTTSQFGPILSDRGMSSAETAAALSAMGMAVIAGRALGGILLDRISSYLIGFIFFVSASIGAVLLMVSSLNGSPYLSAILLGLALGGEGDVMAYLLRRRYGQKSYGKIFGLCFGMFALGSLIGPLILGKAYDLSHSYDQIGLIFGAAGVAAAFMLVAVSRIPAEQESWQNAPIH